MQRILIVDDEPSITFGLTRCLQSSKVSVICCNDSTSARKVIADNGIDAVITDMRLTPADLDEGIDFVGYLRSRSNRLPVIVISGSEDLGVQAVQNGANYFLPKPVDLDRLIGLLHGLGLEVGP